MRGIWAVSRQTLAQALRMKIALMFILLLGVFLAVLPALMEGDGTLAGKIQTFLAYGLSATQLLLILITVFVSTAVVSQDIRDKHIFTIATKPVSRWQYIVGRWLGVVLLDLLLLALAAAGCLGMVQYLRTTRPINALDHRKVETQVLTARRRVRPNPPPIRQLVTERIEKLKTEGRYDQVIDEMKTLTGGNVAAAEKRLLEEIRKQQLEKFESVPPGGTKSWRFENVDVVGNERRATGVVTDRSPDGDLLRIETDPQLVGHLVVQGPVGVDRFEGQVVDVGWDFLVVRFDAHTMEQMARPLLVDQSVELTAEPLIQIDYKLVPSATSVPGNVLKSEWLVRNPQTPGAFHLERRDDPPQTVATLTVPARIVSEDGRTVLGYRNLPNVSANFATAVSVDSDELRLLYRAGDFEGNFLRGVTLIALQLVFLAAVGVFAGGFASFPVACLVCLVIVPFGLAGQFFSEALDLQSGSLPDRPVSAFGYIVMKGMKAILPDLARMSPSKYLVAGHYIPPAMVGKLAATTIGIHTLIALLLACAIFHRRELARVQA